MKQREELSRFLKAARARLNPQDVGLPKGARRRAKGLRREEVAALAGMSLSWYTWFEQGREVQFSAAMLDRLAVALRLSALEREFLFALSQQRRQGGEQAGIPTVPPAVQHMMDSLGIPALVIADDWTVIGWNNMVARLFRDYGKMQPAERNLLKILLLSENYRHDAEAYREMVRQLTARLKWDYSRAGNVDSFDRLIDELSEQCEMFRRFWAGAEIMTHVEGINSVYVPEVGDIVFRHTSYAIEQAPGQHLFLFAPIDAESEARLGQLMAMASERQPVQRLRPIRAGGSNKPVE